MNNSDLLKLAKEVSQKAYSPYSNFRVGAAVLAQSGKTFSGCNVENSSYPCAVCAEKNAISTMVAAGDRIISKIAVVGSGEGFCFPCGNCRQFIFEFSTENTQIILYDGQTEKTMTIQELLPYGFKLDFPS